MPLHTRFWNPSRLASLILVGAISFMLVTGCSGTKPSSDGASDETPADQSPADEQGDDAASGGDASGGDEESNTVTPGVAEDCASDTPEGSDATYRVGPTRTHKTLEEVAPLLVPGDVVEVDGDATYGSVTFTKAGTDVEPITIRGRCLNGKRPHLAGGTITVHFRNDDPDDPGSDAAHHYLFENFEVTGGTSQCIFHQSDDLTIRNAIVHDCPQHGILGADHGSGSLTLEYSEVYDAGAGDQKHQIYVATDLGNFPGSVLRIQFSYIHDANGGNNIKSRAERTEIYYNWIEGATYYEIELIGSEKYDTHTLAQNADVVGNVILQANDNAPLRIGSDGSGTSRGRARFAHNTIAADSSSYIFRIYGELESIEWYNNVILRIGNSDKELCRIVEPTVWLTGSPIIIGEKNWLSSSIPLSCYQEEDGSTLSLAWQGTLSGSDPGLVDAAIATFDPHLVSTSPLIDQGTATTTGAPFSVPDPLVAIEYLPVIRDDLKALARPVHGTIDIGAYEY